MNELFLKIINMSISASWLVLAVLILRFVLKKAPKWVNVLLWGIVAVRLICPFSFESALSLIPSAETIPLNIGMDTTPTINSGINAINNAVNPIISQSNTPMAGASVNPLQITIGIYEYIWIFGIIAFALYTAISYWHLRRKVDTAIRYKDNIFQSENVNSPFVLGIINPRIYLPFSMNVQDLEHVVAHEKAHIRRKDHWWKPLGFLLLTIHWFNPLMWLAYVLLCRDIELACDERVIKELGNEQRADYTQALVACSVNRRMIAACPLAFGEVGVKERVKSVMNYKKPAFWIVVLAVIACVIVAVCFLTNPIVLGDYFVLSSADSPANTNKLTYDIQLGNKTMSGEIYVEQWIDGTCVKAAPVIMTQYVDSIEITMRDHREDGTSVGTDVQIETNQYGGSLLTYFEHPKHFGAIGWGFKGYELNKKRELAPNEEVILAAKVFDNGSGIRAFDCETLVNEPERVENAAYMLVVRAVFSEAPLGVTNHSEASLPTEVLTLNDVIILSQKGYNLSWSDFDDYDYIETGSGLYIRVYEINDWFQLMIGGGSPDSDPMYIYLKSNDGSDDKIDIRDGGVTEFISKHNSQSTDSGALIPMVMVDGILYLDTGYESTTEARCGVVDGEITSQVHGSQRPNIDDQSNFGSGYGYQYGATEGTIEIYMDGEWRIFATEEVRQEIQFPTSEETITYNGKEYKKSELCDATLIWLELSEHEKIASSYMPPEFMIYEETWGITLIAENVTPTGITIKCTQSGGEPTGELRTGSWYILETWTQEKGWHEAPCFAEVAWTQEAWIIPMNDSCEWKVDWEWLYGTLSEGKYRIGKEIMDYRDTGDHDKAIYYIEFEITK